MFWWASLGSGCGLLCRLGSLGDLVGVAWGFLLGLLWRGADCLLRDGLRSDGGGLGGAGLPGRLSFWRRGLGGDKAGWWAGE